MQWIIYSSQAIMYMYLYFNMIEDKIVVPSGARWSFTLYTSSWQGMMIIYIVHPLLQYVYLHW